MDTRKEMKIERAEEDKEKITVTTTGARYVFDKSGKIFCYQLLNRERLMATLDFNASLPGLTIEKKDAAACMLFYQPAWRPVVTSAEKDYRGTLRLQVNCDSLLEIVPQVELNIAVSGSFLPDYNAEEDGNILLIDETGGIGFYPCKGLKSVESAFFSSEKWLINYKMDINCQFLVSVFPPRRFNHAQSFEDRISHHGSLGEWDPPPPAYPSDEQIEELGRYTNILVLHEMIWQGRLTRKGIPVKTLADLYADGSFYGCEFVPADEKELTRVMRKAHSLKMKVIPYMSPHYSSAKGGDFLDKLKDRLEKYSFDGVYFDTLYKDVLLSYQLIRSTRALLNDRLLYVHCSAGPLGRYIYCPFIDTYADYILRAEWGKGFLVFDDKYLRYVISGYNISNAIGHICYYELPPDFIHKIIDRTLAVKARFYLGSPETEREILLKKEYFPKLEDAKKRNR